jgi:WD40 repeat protein
MNRNVGFDGISLMGTGVHGTIDGNESDNLVAVLAHNCRLESFTESESASGNYWQATFFVPQGPTSDGSNRSLSQERLDAMQAEGVQFTLDHTRDQPSSAPAFPQPQAETITPERLNYFTTGHDIRVACTPDAALIVAANGNPTRILLEGGTSRVKGNWKPTADVLDGQTGKVIASLKLTTADEDAVLAATERVSGFEVTAVAIAPAGDLVAVGTSIGQVKLYRARTGELVRSLDDEPARLAHKNIPEHWKPLRRAMGRVAALAFSPDGRLLAVCGGSFREFSDIFDTISDLTREVTGPGRLKVWDVNTGALTHDMVGHSDASAVAFSPDGNLLASAGSWLSPGGDNYGTGVILWNPQTGEKLRTISNAANGGTHAVAFSPNSKRIVFGATLYDNENATSFTAVNMAYALSGVVAWTQRVPGGATPVGFSPDGNSMLVRSQQSIRFLNAETGALEREVTSNDLSFEGRWDGIAIAPRAGRLVIGTVDDEEGNVAIWNFDEPGAGADAESQRESATDAP